MLFRSRRLRIATVSLGMAATPVQLYTSCDAPATALVLMHKVLGAAAAEGSLTAARALLQEWLAALAASASAVLASEEAARQSDGAGDEQLEGRGLLQEPPAKGEGPPEGGQVSWRAGHLSYVCWGFPGWLHDPWGAGVAFGVPGVRSMRPKAFCLNRNCEALLVSANKLSLSGLECSVGIISARFSWAP